MSLFYDLLTDYFQVNVEIYISTWPVNKYSNTTKYFKGVFFISITHQNQTHIVITEPIPEY